MVKKQDLHQEKIANLSPEQRRITEGRGTEPPFSGKHVYEKRPGMYVCAVCGNHLFSSKTKFDSGTGWPSFWNAISSDAVKTDIDTSLGIRRIEVRCAKCGSHLGHLFADDPQPTGKRYCINSLALDLRLAKKGDKKKTP